MFKTGGILLNPELTNLVQDSQNIQSYKNFSDNLQNSINFSAITEDLNVINIYSDDDETDLVVSIDQDGIKAKGFYDLSGNTINKNASAETINEIYCFRNEGVDTGNCFYGLNSIKNALDSINDANVFNKYRININGHYVFDNDVTLLTKFLGGKNNSNAWITNVYGKDYVILDGGSKDDTSIEVYLSLETNFPHWDDGEHKYYGGNYHVIFNNAKWFECKNITFIGHNTRYCLHQESFNERIGSYALFENCVFKLKYDGIWVKENLSLPEGSTIYDGNTVHGCGYRTDGKINFKNCELYSYSPYNTNPVIIGSHTGFFVNQNFKPKPATISYDKCLFQSVANYRFIEYRNISWDATDKFYITNSIFNKYNFVDFGVRTVSSGGKAIYTTKGFIDSNPLPIKNTTDGTKVLKIQIKGKGFSKIRVLYCDAYEIFGGYANDEIYTETEWGGKLLNGIIFKDDYYGTDGYCLGTISLSQNNLKSILGDCSAVNKTLKLSINDETLEFNLINNFSELTDNSILDILNELNKEIVFSFDYLSNYYFPSFKNLVLSTNNGEKTIFKGMGVICNSNGFRIASKSDDFIDGICIDDTPIGEHGRIALKGVFTEKYINYIGQLKSGTYKISENDGIFAYYSGNTISNKNMFYNNNGLFEL